MNTTIKATLIALSSLLLSAPASAALIATPLTDCSAVSINYIGVTPTSGNLAPNSINSTSCIRVTESGNGGANDEPYNKSGWDNVGLFDQGTLNSEPFSYYVNGEGASLFDADWVNLDLNGDGIPDVYKPGWIGLATYNKGVDYFEVTDFDLAKVLEFTFTPDSDLKSGTWFLAVDAAAIFAARDLLGNSYFDHLNLILKVGKEYISYNFDFNNPLFDFVDLNRNYSIGGIWSTKDFRNSNDEQQALSHATVAAHDPVRATSTIPAPAPFWLLGLGLALLLVNRKVQS